ncbi:hypothetical protein [Dyella nitratireducens]|uniref:Uncharacterized protein n=1 Tax=Dyella nitratireducens TaxID=1849580 RepID=A0ABQ1GAT8_9GAMM|nr:hypothetical protein [Dyella nitratireducens]GGA40104.1 hypothetical protein GCM10010981_31710 [Dyella nitratireducens]GLQ40529.1 hypothetical protein GCM10007902_03780 [Dyella nitratireducens]
MEEILLDEMDKRLRRRKAFLPRSDAAFLEIRETLADTGVVLHHPADRCHGGGLIFMRGQAAGSRLCARQPLLSLADRCELKQNDIEIKYITHKHYGVNGCRSDFAA